MALSHIASRAAIELRVRTARDGRDAVIGGGLRRRGLRRQQERAGRDGGQGRRRLRRRRADRDPDRGLERQRAVREERRRAARALQHDEADDGGIRVPRAAAGRHQAHRRIQGQRKRLAQGRRARRRLDHVRRNSQPGVGRQPAAWRHHPERQRFLHGAGRSARRQRDRVRREADAARPRTRPAALDLRQLERITRSRQQDERARTGQTGATSDPDLSGLLQDFSASANSPGTRSGSRTAIRC